MAASKRAWMHFGIAAGLLLVGAISWNGTLEALGWALNKRDVPLVQPLEALDLETLPEYPLLAKPELDEYTLELLGTEQTITWRFQDVRASERLEATVIVDLHVAYYTGLRDAVPHVPDVCVVASGYTPVGSDNLTLTNPDLPEQWAAWREVTATQSSFRQAASSFGPASERVSAYVFSVNGRPMNDRNDVRIFLSDPSRKYCYFAKIEMSAMALRQSRGGQTQQFLLPDQEHDRIVQEFWQAISGEVLSHFATELEIEQMEQAQQAPADEADAQSE